MMAAASQSFIKHLRRLLFLRCFDYSGLFTQSQWYLHDLPFVLPAPRALCSHRDARRLSRLAGLRWRGQRAWVGLER